MVVSERRSRSQRVPDSRGQWQLVFDFAYVSERHTCTFGSACRRNRIDAAVIGFDALDWFSPYAMPDRLARGSLLRLIPGDTHPDLPQLPARSHASYSEAAGFRHPAM